jgi:hypothetical protein
MMRMLLRPRKLMRNMTTCLSRTAIHVVLDCAGTSLAGRIRCGYCIGQIMRIVCNPSS